MKTLSSLPYVGHVRVIAAAINVLNGREKFASIERLKTFCGVMNACLDCY